MTVTIQIGGVAYKLQSSAAAEDVERLAARVESKLHEINPTNRPMTPQTFLLAAMALAHEAELAEQRAAEALSQCGFVQRDAESRARQEQQARQRIEADAAERLQREQDRRRALEAEMRALLRRVVTRIDLAIDEHNEATARQADEEHDEPSP